MQHSTSLQTVYMAHSPVPLENRTQVDSLLPMLDEFQEARRVRPFSLALLFCPIVPLVFPDV